MVDTLPDPSVKDDTGKQSLLTQVCARSLAIGQLDGVDGSRPFCTSDGVGAVLAVFWSGPGYHGTVTRVVSLNQTGNATPFIPEYKGVKVELAQFGQDYSKGQVVPIRGTRLRSRPCPPTRSPRPALVSIRRSAPPTRRSRKPPSPRPAASAWTR